MSLIRSNAIDLLPSPAEWERLSVVPEKRNAFSRDLYFRECWADTASFFDDSASKILRSLAVLTMKPDAVVGRRMTRILDYTADQGFVPIAVAPLHLTRHSIRELWRYDWHVYPVTRLVFSTHWYTSTETLIFVLQEVGQQQRFLPASVRLSSLKGSALPDERKRGDLRTMLDPPNRILNFVHVTDEPADIVRELGIFLDLRERRALLKQIKQHWGKNRRETAAREIARLEALHPEHDLDFMASLGRLEACSAVTHAAAEHARKLFHHGDKVGWDDLCSIVDPSAADRWDFICVASNLIVYEREASPGVLSADVVANRWSRVVEEWV